MTEQRIYSVKFFEALVAENSRQKQFIGLVHWIIAKGYDSPASMIQRIKLELALIMDNEDSVSGKQSTCCGDASHGCQTTADSKQEQSNG